LRGVDFHGDRVAELRKFLVIGRSSNVNENATADLPISQSNLIFNLIVLSEATKPTAKIISEQCF